MKEEVKLPLVNKMSTAGSVAVFVLSCNCVYGISTILTGSNGVAFKGRSFTLTCEVISGDLDAVVFMNNDNIIASVSYTNGECKHRETSYICVPGTCSCNGKNRYTWTVLSVLGSWHNTTLNSDSIYGGVRSNIYTLYVSEHKKMAKTLETCTFCFENVPKHLIIAIGMKEIVRGMVDAEPGLWRKPKKENFDDQRKKVLQFAEWWKPYHWTNRLEGT